MSYRDVLDKAAATRSLHRDEAIRLRDCLVMAIDRAGVCSRSYFVAVPPARAETYYCPMEGSTEDEIPRPLEITR